MEKELWQFTDSLGSFQSKYADKFKSLYFPLANEALMSSITPDLHGDSKTGNNSFLMQPVSRIDLAELKSSRNFWIYINENKIWSATGVSKNFQQVIEDSFNLEAGLLWHKVTRENKGIGLKAEILSFVPSGTDAVEIMQVKLTNISNRKVQFIPTAAIPIYGRAANNLRDHRHVTSLLQRITLDKLGLMVKPTLIFDESGHKNSKNIYFVLGWDELSHHPQYIYPTQEMFCGEAGDLEAPEAILKNKLPGKRAHIQGKEAMGALRFKSITLGVGKSYSYIVAMGITEDKKFLGQVYKKFKNPDKINLSLQKTKKYWVAVSDQVSLYTGNSNFDNWFRWVSIQPALRRIFGCSFLPDFDYGKGGRGWRDLWQDCLGLILGNHVPMRNLLINNFSGVRIDGSNATIIGKKTGEFIADRNNITRVWMDHGIWPIITLNLYINETGDTNVLFEQTSYFRDFQLNRSKIYDYNWNPISGQQLKTPSGRIYQGSILEHLLVQNLVQFFNVGIHNYVRLEDADWNDGLDMAKENGESVAFSSMYAYTLGLLSELLSRMPRKKIEIAKELRILLHKINYDSVGQKHKALNEYFTKTSRQISGEKIKLSNVWLAQDLKEKSEWMMKHIRKHEWLKLGFFNGYYDNDCQRVEGLKKYHIRMMLESQVFPIMSGVATDNQVARTWMNCRMHLWNKELGGYHLNTDFREEQPKLGRAFSFIYGDKENGAFFSHMVVMLANALYKRGFVKEGWNVLSSIYRMAVDTKKSKIYPCIPEYFNLEGRGLYSYLTGSASWFVLTMLTEVFGVKGKYGDLFIEPKLTAEQFQEAATISVRKIFCDKQLSIHFFNPDKLDYGQYRIIKVRLNNKDFPPQKESKPFLIKRETILKLPVDKINTLYVTLG